MFSRRYLAVKAFSSHSCAATISEEVRWPEFQLRGRLLFQPGSYVLHVRRVQWRGTGLARASPTDDVVQQLGVGLHAILQKTREKEGTKLQDSDTFDKIPKIEAEGQGIISLRFVDIWEETGELRSRLCSRGYEARQVDPASLFAASPSVTATRLAFGIGICAGRGHRTGGHLVSYLHAELEEPYYVKRPVESRKPRIICWVKRYLHGDKRAPWWPDHFEATTQNLIFVRWASEPGSFVKKGATQKDTTIGIVHVDDLLSVGKRKNLDNSFLQLAGTQKLKRVEHMEIGKSVLFLGGHITRYKDRITLKSK